MKLVTLIQKRYSQNGFDIGFLSVAKPRLFLETDASVEHGFTSCRELVQGVPLFYLLDMKYFTAIAAAVRLQAYW